MGTNYYVQPEPAFCPTCGHAFERLHIGKSSAGWCFSLHVDERFKDLYDWEAYLTFNRKIVDEYGRVFSLEDLRKIILGRSGSPYEVAFHKGYTSWEAFHKANSSEFGPRGLLRHKIDGVHCIGHGNGTYDHITGDFS